jgi:hypothetical protein
LTTPRSSKPPSPDSADAIGKEIEVSQRWALPQHSCKPRCPVWSDWCPVWSGSVGAGGFSLPRTTESLLR